MQKRSLLELLDCAEFYFGEDFLINVNPDENKVNKYINKLKLFYKMTNAWKISILNYEEMKQKYNITVFEFDERVVGGVSFNRSSEPQKEIYSFFQDKSLIPPIKLVEMHNNIIYPALLVLDGRARQRKYWKYVSEFFLEAIRAMGGDFAMMAPALRPRRLDLLYRQWGFTRISPPLFADHYKRFEGDTEPNCVLMMRAVNPNCELDPALVAYGG